MRIEYHRTLIADRVRNAAFFRALKAVIEPGKTVVADIGAGTGLLGLMASKLGAKAVYLFETAEVAGVAAEILKANKAKRCHLIPCHSTEFRDRIAADVIVSETLGNYALEENIIATLADARARLMKREGQIIPHAIVQYVVPVTASRIDDELRAWQRIGHDIDLFPAQTMTLNNVYVRLLQPSELLAGGKAAVQWDAIDLSTETRSNRKGAGTWRLDKPAAVYGFAVWWSADLGAGVTLSTAPTAPRTHWEQLYFPLLEPISGRAGDRISVELRSKSSEAAGTHLAWTAVHESVRGNPRSRQVLNLDKGYLP